jgi:hypothetical protein
MILSFIGFAVLLVFGVVVGATGIFLSIFSMRVTGNLGTENVAIVAIGTALIAFAIHLAPFTVTISG